MKIIKTFWRFALNLTLIIAPWFIVGLFMIQFGQPLLNQFKQFLGSPIDEISRMVVDLKERPDQPIHFSQINRELGQMAARDQISDTEAHQLRKSVIELHEAVLQRAELSTEKGHFQDLSDSYSLFFENTLISRIFTRPALLTEQLMADLKRIHLISNLPYHSAQGMDIFSEKATTVSETIRTYGEIYSNPLLCDRIAGMDCASIYNTSIELTVGHLRQYLESWPLPGDHLSPDPQELWKLLPDLSLAYQQLVPRTSGYLNEAPWNQLELFKTSHDRFRLQFRSGLRDWYEKVLQRVDLAHGQFRGDLTPFTREMLTALIELEEFIGTERVVHEILIDAQTEQTRREFISEISTVYLEVTALDRFDPEYRLSSEGQQYLLDILDLFPEGKQALDEKNYLLSQLENSHNNLTTALRQRNYSELISSLNQVEKQYQEQPTGWGTLLQIFLKQSHEQFSHPDWLPTSQEEENQYSELIHFAGELGNEMNLPEFSGNWVEQTIITMRSRRFSQLRHEIEDDLVQLVDNPDRMVRVLNHLHEMDRLDNLPDELRGEPVAVITRSAFAERMVFSTNQVYQSFSEQIESHSRWSEPWNRLDLLMNASEQLTTEQILEQINLTNYLEEIENISHSFDRGTPLDDFLVRQIFSRLGDFFDRLDRDSREWISEGELDRDRYIILRENLSKFNSALQRAQEFPHFQSEAQPVRWLDLLRFRERITELLEVTPHIQKGRLIGGNPHYDQYRELLSELPEWSLPRNYDFNHERSQLNRLNQIIRERAEDIQQSAEQDWLAGWGGRISGDQVLQPWTDFLDTLVRTVEDPETREEIQTWLRDNRNRLEEWDN